MENEIWKDITGYEGSYQVSNLGRVKSLDRYKNYKSSVRIVKGRILSLTKSRGYFYAGLCLNGERVHHTVSRLVALHFIDNPFYKPVVNHIDGDKTNNCSLNLEFCTSSENTIHALNTGLKTPLKGEKHPSNKFKNDDIYKIRDMHSTGLYTFAKIARIYKVSPTIIQYIVKRKSWVHLI